jgi:uncharacterized protein
LEQYGTSTEALYVTMDSLNVTNISILEIAAYHINNGGMHLFIDEIHKYQNWSQELKNINDL